MEPADDLAGAARRRLRAAPDRRRDPQERARRRRLLALMSQQGIPLEAVLDVWGVTVAPSGGIDFLA